MKDSKMVVAAEFTNARDAAIAAGMLENHDIECHVMDDAMSTLYGAGATWAPPLSSANTPTTEANKSHARSVLRTKPIYTYHRLHRACGYIF